jgi:hypothetical protein
LFPLTADASIIARLRPAETSQMEIDTIPRERVMLLIQQGKLPGQPLVGIECAVCDLPVSADQSEMQVEFLRDHGAEVLEVFHFHVRCFAKGDRDRLDAVPAARRKRGRSKRKRVHCRCLPSGPLVRHRRCQGPPVSGSFLSFQIRGPPCPRRGLSMAVRLLRGEPEGQAGGDARCR